MTKKCKICGNNYEVYIKHINEFSKSFYVGECLHCKLHHDELQKKQEIADKKREEDEKKLARKNRLIKAGLKTRYYNSSIDAIRNTALKNIIKGYTQKPQNLIISGAIGIGKTYAMQALVKHYDGQAHYFLLKQIFDEIKKAWNPAKYINYDHLFIDEVGIQYDTKFEYMHLYEIINERYNLMKPTILSSNLDIDKITNILSRRLIDRLMEEGTQHHVTGKNHRREK